MTDMIQCPFCGGNKLKLDCKSKNEHLGYHVSYSVRCNICHSRGGVASGYIKANSWSADKVTIVTKDELKEKAIELWNRRA